MTASPLALSITFPVDHASLEPRQVRVEGTLSAPINTGVTVNGRVALVNSGVFKADGVSLVPGDNIIVATATAITAETLSKSVRVSSQWQPEILTLRAIERSALAGKTVRFEYEFQSRVPLFSLTMDFDGDGTDDFTTSDPASPLIFQYTTAGLYVARLRAVDANGDTYQAEVPVDVQSLAGIEPVFQGLCGGMRQSLQVGDVTSVLQFVTSSTRSKFQSVWTALLPHMSSLYASYSPLQGYDITTDLTTYFITRVVNGETRVYFVQFIRDPDGVWRLDDM